MADIFISYSRKDGDRIQPFYEHLKSLGLNVWIDRQIPIGAEWDQEIDRQLRACIYAVVFWSENSVGSREVVSEARFAHSNEKLWQVRLEPCTVNYRFEAEQIADASHPHFREKLGDLKKLVEARRNRDDAILAALAELRASFGPINGAVLRRLLERGDIAPESLFEISDLSLGIIREEVESALGLFGASLPMDKYEVQGELETLEAVQAIAQLAHEFPDPSEFDELIKEAEQTLEEWEAREEEDGI